MKTLRELSEAAPLNEAILHSVVDRDPPPKYLTQLLDLRQQDLLTDEETVIFQKRQWCLPLEIAAILSSDCVFEAVLKATKEAMHIMHTQAPTQQNLKELEILAGPSIEKISPARLKLIIQSFPQNNWLELSLLEAILLRHDSAPWPWVRCILETYSCLKKQEDAQRQRTDLAVSFFQLISSCYRHDSFASHQLTKIPKFLRYLATQYADTIFDKSMLHVALNTLIPMLSDGRLQKRVVKEVLEIITQVCPGSALHRDYCKQLPLHVAVHCNLDGSEHIVNAYPEALMIRCPMMKLYPFQLASVANNGSSVELAWKLLRAAPGLLLATNLDHEWSPQDLRLAKHEMTMARTSRNFQEQIKALKQARDQVLTNMSSERQALQKELQEDEQKQKRKRVSEVVGLQQSHGRACLSIK